MVLLMQYKYIGFNVCIVDSVLWSTDRALLERAPGSRDLPYSSYRLVKPTAAMRLINFTTHIAAVVLDAIKKQTFTPRSATKEFSIDCFKVLQDHTNTLLRNAIVLARNPELFRQIDSEYTDAKSYLCMAEEDIRKASVIVSRYFAVHKPIFSHRALLSDFKKYRSQTLKDIDQETYKFLGMKRSKKPISYTLEDLRLFAPGRDIPDPKELTCYGYALLKARVLEAKDFIFTSSRSDEKFDQLLDHLGKWGYEVTENPSAGDLVVYLKDGVIQHVGIYTSSGKILSKLGIQSLYTHLHPLFDVPAFYGFTVVFWHKAAPLY